MTDHTTLTTEMTDQHATPRVTPRVCEAHFGMRTLMCYRGCGKHCIAAEPEKVNAEIDRLTRELAERTRERDELAGIVEGCRAELKTVRDGFAREFANGCKLQHDFDEMQLRAVSAERALAEARWISVGERLPEGRALFHLRYESNTCMDAGEWSDFDGSGWEITHWQPLPAPPSAEQEKAG